MEFRKRRLGSVEILQELGLLRATPVPVEEIARRLSVEVLRRTNPGYAGAVLGESETGNAWIWVDTENSRHRQRFTIAHELGHLILHPLGKHHRDASFGYGQRVRKMEEQANAFAGSLLMPRISILPFLTQSSASVARLAQRFDVSVAAMNVRVKWILRGKYDV